MNTKIDISKTEWDLTPLLADESKETIERQRKEAKDHSERFISKWKKDKRYLKDPVFLKNALDEYELWLRKYGADGGEGFYFSLRSSINQNDPQIKASVNQVNDFGTNIENEMQFFTLDLAKVPLKYQKLFLSDQELVPYKHYLEHLFLSSKYLLSDKEEKILNLKSQPAYRNWTRMVSGFLAKEEAEVYDNGQKTKKVNFSELLSLLDNQNKFIRDSAAVEFNRILEKHLDTAEAEINSVLQNKKIDDELRGVKRPDEIRHISDDIESKTVDTLIKSISDNYAISKDYYALKARLMGVTKLEYHERNISIGKVERKYTYEEAVDKVYGVLNNLSPVFGSYFKEFIENGQVDVYPKANKKSGAFCADNLISQPTYILLNFTGRLNDLLTIGHEFGHGINSNLIKTKQNALNFGTPLSTAEVSSTFIEDFILEEILKTADDEMKFSIIMQKLNDDISTIFRQAACYQFETELHRSFRAKGYLSKTEIGEIFQKNMVAYMGPAVNQSDGAENWWVYWSHIRTFFYVYSYASGLLISKSLQKSVKQDPQFIDKITTFLSAGQSESPKEIFIKLGIDIGKKDFWDKGIKEIEKLLVEAKILAKKLNKI